MKIKIDTTNKRITIEEEVNIKDFFNLLNKLFKEEEWKEFDLETTLITNWNNPITLPWTQPHIPNIPYDPIHPWQPTIMYSTSDDSIERLNKGVFNIECNLNNK